MVTASHQGGAGLLTRYTVLFDDKEIGCNVEAGEMRRRPKVCQARQGHAMPIPSPCQAHAMPMPSPCRAHAKPMPSPCQAHANSLPLTTTHYLSSPLTTTHYHSLSLTATHYHSLPLTTTHYHSLPLTTTHYHWLITAHYPSLPLPTTHYHSLPLTTTHYHSLPLAHYRSLPVTTSHYHWLTTTWSAIVEWIECFGCNASSDSVVVLTAQAAGKSGCRGGNDGGRLLRQVGPRCMLSQLRQLPDRPMLRCNLYHMRECLLDCVVIPTMEALYMKGAADLQAISKFVYDAAVANDCIFVLSPCAWKQVWMLISWSRLATVGHS